MSELPGLADMQRVADHLAELKKSTNFPPLDPFLAQRTREIDGRIAGAGLGVAEKVEIFRRLAPSAEQDRWHAATGESDELRMERLLLSVAAGDLPAFKFALEYDGNYKDLEEYLFHDIDNAARQDRIVAHLKGTPASGGVKVLSDVDDTMYLNLMDRRYRKKTFYPGVLEFYDAVKAEPFAPLPGIPITTLSARPNPVAGKLEETSLGKLGQLTGGRLRPSGLSGSFLSSTFGTVESLLRLVRRPRREEVETPQGPDDDALFDRTPHGQEDKIGEAKFANFARFAAVYPEYRFVFVGDSGQADTLTARLMLGHASTEGTGRVITTFIHDLRQSDGDSKAASSSFQTRPLDLVVGRTSPSARGIIVFRDYIEAAIIAYLHRSTLDDLITAEELAAVTTAALGEFKQLVKSGGVEDRRLPGQYRQHGEEASALLTPVAPQSSAVAAQAKKIREILDDTSW